MWKSMPLREFMQVDLASVGLTQAIAVRISLGEFYLMWQGALDDK